MLVTKCFSALDLYNAFMMLIIADETPYYGTTLYAIVMTSNLVTCNLCRDIAFNVVNVAV